MSERQKILESPDYPLFKAEMTSYDCKDCSLSKERTRLVVSRGNPDAKILIIGEAPGREEDLSGHPFVGRAGRLLDAAFTECGMDTNRDALVANVVKCRPPGNRPPSRVESETCLPFLRKQIELVNPRFIVLLGATALKHLLPEKAKIPMGQLVGKVFTSGDWPAAEMIVFYHPAYILRDPRKKPVMREHIEILRDRWLGTH